MASQEFSNLLRQSKVLHLNPKQPIAITSQAGYLKRGDFGLKRPLPASSRGSPFFLVKSLDTSSSRKGQGQTDFVSSAQSSLFAKRWDESGYKAQQKGNSLPLLSASPFAATSHEALPLKASTQKPSPNDEDVPSPTESYTLPDPVSLSQTEFELFLAELRKVQPEFKAFLERHHGLRLAAARKVPLQKQLEVEEAQAAKTSQGLEVDLYQHSMEIGSPLNDVLPQFLRSEVGQRAWQNVLASRSSSKQHETALEGNEHPHLGLSYSEDPDFDDKHFEQSVPVRLLQKDENADTVQPFVTVSALGLAAVASADNLKDGKIVNTPFEAHTKGLLTSQKPIEKQGFAQGRLTQRQIPEFPGRSDGSNRERRPVWQYEESLRAFERGDGQALVPELRVEFGNIKVLHNYSVRKPGSREWVSGPDQTADVSTVKAGYGRFLWTGRSPADVRNIVYRESRSQPWPHPKSRGLRSPSTPR